LERAREKAEVNEVVFSLSRGGPMRKVWRSSNSSTQAPIGNKGRERHMANKSINVLFIEDNPGDVRLVRELLAEAHWGRVKLECADRLSAGLERLAEGGLDCVLLDLTLPDSTEFDTFERVHAHTPEIAIVIISGLDDEALAIKAVKGGAQDYLVKDHLGGYVLGRSIRYAIERKQAEEALLREKNFSAAVINSSPGLLFVFDDKGNIIQWNRNAEKITGYSAKEISKMNVLDFVAKEDQKTAAEAMQEVFTKGQSSVEINVLSKPGKKTPFYLTGLRTKFENTTCVVCTGIDVTERKQAEEEVKRGYEQLQETLISTVHALATTVEMRDPYTAGHQRRTTILACAMAEEMGLTEEQFDGLRMAGLVHDIGKISVPAAILNKPGSLSEIEFNIIKTHPQVGYNILKEIEFSWPVAQIVLQHHERLDGSGYPQGLRGEEIMLEAKILAVADVVEAMASHRPFRPALGIEAALEKIAKNQGILYEPEIVDVCKRLFTEKGFTFD
jgi:PAS domain S-box-containing protein/putative nucleotidyltransferase with HDIG domain